MMKLPADRINRYEDKIHFIVEDMRLFEEWFPQDVKEFIADVKTRKAVYKIIQEVVDCIMDLVAMMLRDEGLPVHDDYTNIGKLRDIGILGDDLYNQLRELNGLRNVIVHKYNGVDDELAYESISELKDAIYSFLKVVRAWLKKKGS